MTDYVRQHAVPAAYLKNFCEDGKPHFWICAHDAPPVLHGTAYKGYPKTFTRQNHRYSQPDDTGGFDTRLEEEVLGPLDDRGMRAVAKVLRRNSDATDEEWANLAKYIRFQYLRTDHFIDQTHQAMVSFQDKIEETAPPDGVIDFDLRGDKPLIVKSMLGNVERISRFLLGMRWTILESKTKDFISSSNPCVVEHTVQRTLWRGGILDPSAMISLPLSPNACWVGNWFPRSAETRLHWVKAEDIEVVSANRIRTRWASHIIGRDRNQIEQLAGLWRPSGTSNI
jgi:hypothetical protein